MKEPIHLPSLRRSRQGEGLSAAAVHMDQEVHVAERLAVLAESRHRSETCVHALLRPYRKVAEGLALHLSVVAVVAFLHAVVASFHRRIHAYRAPTVLCEGVLYVDAARLVVG